MNDASNNPGSKNFSYFFNICKNVDPASLPGFAGIPSAAAPPFPDPTKTAPGASQWDVPVQGPAGWCNATIGGIGVAQWSVPNALIGPAAAFQYNNIPGAGYDQCHHLGSAPLTSSSERFGLYDPANPSRGLYIQYLNGDRCPGVNKARSLKVWLLCDPDATNIPDSELVVEAPGSCVYEIFVRTAYGCPAECPVVTDTSGSRSSGRLCNNHGLCEFDPAISNSRCFCNDGWTGADCTGSVATQPGLSSVGIGLICLGIFLAGTLGFLVYLWNRIRSLRLDPDAYSSLRGGPEEPGATGAVAVSTAIQ